MNYLKQTPQGWQPPHCPNPKCRFHRPLPEGFPFKEAGTYTRKNDNRRIQRYLCKACGRSFSTQTFSTTYWMKKPDLIGKIFMKTVGGMANRQIARDLKVSPSTVDRTIARMGRHCMLKHIQLMQTARPPTEIIVDGFVSFEYSQYFPFHQHNAVEKNTDFFFYFTDSEVRRSGTMTQVQMKRRRELEEEFGKPDPQAVRKDMLHLLEVTLKGSKSPVVHSDAHQSYPWSFRQLEGPVNHVVTPGKNHRDRYNKLWGINLLDLLIRHSSSNHKRETLSWSKRRQGSADRMAIFLVWRNYMNGRREKDRNSPTPAMERGMLDGRLTVEEVFGGRIFRDHCQLPTRWSTYYDRTIETRAMEVNLRHELNYAR